MKLYTITAANVFSPLDERMRGRQGLCVYVASDVNERIAQLRRQWEAGEANAVHDFLVDFGCQPFSAAGVTT